MPLHAGGQAQRDSGERADGEERCARCGGLVLDHCGRLRTGVNECTPQETRWMARLGQASRPEQPGHGTGRGGLRYQDLPPRPRTAPHDLATGGPSAAVDSISTRDRPSAPTKGPNRPCVSRASCPSPSCPGVVIAGCTTASAGWTYAPAPSATPAPSTAASAAAPAGAAPSGSGQPDRGQISALGIKYEQTTVTAPAGTPFQIAFENKDAGIPHNVSLHLGGATGAELFKGDRLQRRRDPDLSTSRPSTRASTPSCAPSTPR